MFKSRWWIAFAAGWINLFIFSIMRSGGVFYVSLLDVFKCTHQQAAWPVSLSGSIASTFGIVVGFASHYLSLRSLIVFGILVASSSVALSYFATTIQFVTLSVGLVQGIGIGFVTCLLPAVLNQHFPDKKAVALGISYAGSTLGAFLFPVVIHHLIKKIGLHETFLYIGLLTSFGLFGTYFLRRKKFHNHDRKRNGTVDYNANDDDDAINDDCEDDFQDDRRDDAHESSRAHKHLIRMKEIASVSQALPYSVDTNRRQRHTPEMLTSTANLATTASIDTTKNIRPLIQECKTIVYVENNKLYENIPDNLSVKVVPASAQTKCDTNSELTLTDEEEEDDDDAVDGVRRVKTHQKCHLFRQLFTNIKNDWKIISNFSFILCSFSYTCFILDFITFIIVIQDIANDRGIDESQTKWLLSIFSITDFVGRILPGWLSYSRLITDKNIYILSLTFLGLSMAMIIIVREWWHFVVLTLICGFSTGCQMVLSPAILSDYFGNENTAITFGLSNFFCGIATLASRPFIIGSKDYYGNYNLLSYLLSFKTIGAAFIWLIESFVTLNIENVK